MQKLRVVVVEDEPLIRAELSAMLAEDPRVVVVGDAAEPSTVENSILAKEVDALFIDIRMPRADGIEFAAKMLRARPELCVVVVTAHADDAVRGFEHGVLDYLLKPVREERLRKSVDRIQDSLAAEELETRKPASTSDAPQNSHAIWERWAVRRRGNLYIVAAADVLYFEVKDELVWAVTEKERTSLDVPLSEIEAHLPNGDFFRCHRGHLVRVSAIVALEPTGAGTYDIVVRHPQEPRIPLARERARVLKERIPVIG